MKAGFVAAVLILVVVVVVVPVVVGQAPTPSQCSDERNNLRNTCWSVVITFWQSPSASCCQLIRAAHVECVCPVVNPKLIAALGGIRRAVRIIRKCGRPIPSNFKCGSVVIP